jgi:hypothetical protein
VTFYFLLAFWQQDHRLGFGLKMKNRRKGFFIALAVLLALFVGFWWLMRPMIDPRLVGMWRKQLSNNDLGQTWTLRSDGISEWETVHGPRLMRWSVDGDQINAWDADFLPAMDDWFERTIGRRYFRTKTTLRSATYRLLETDRMEFRLPGPGQPDYFVRVPD